MALSFQTANDAIFDALSLFVVAPERHLKHANLSPFGEKVRWHIDPEKRSSTPFLMQLQRLDGLTFGPTGMPMERWLFYEHAELAGLIVGMALLPEALNEQEKKRLKLPKNHKDPVPVSMYIAIPSMEKDTWFGHNLASLASLFPLRPWSYLGTITKALGLKVMGAKVGLGITQWDSPAVFLHSRFSALHLESVWSPNHSFESSLSYAFPVNDLVLQTALSKKRRTYDESKVSFWLEAQDETLIRLQKDMEKGKRLSLLGPPKELPGKGKRFPILVET